MQLMRWRLLQGVRAVSSARKGSRFRQVHVHIGRLLAAYAVIILTAAVSLLVVDILLVGAGALEDLRFALLMGAVMGWLPALTVTAAWSGGILDG